jgi:putative nucleotidyltransferase with HDIG domain
MTPAARLLTTLAQALASEALYGAAHPATARAVEAATDAMLLALPSGRALTVTFRDGDVLVDGEPDDALRGWDWARRLSAARVERLEFEPGATSDDMARLVEELHARLSGRGLESAEVRQLAPSRIRYGLVAVGGGGRPASAPPDGAPRAAPAPGRPGLQDEAATVRWLHDEAAGATRLPMAEVDAVVRMLALAMHGERRLLLPLLELRAFDEYTTTHAINVAMLSMGLAEQLGLGPSDVRAFGTAGLLHDIGKVRIPRDILTKPGRLTDEERAVIQQHPAEGARMVLERERSLQLAAVVAYEHHICLDGGGYPHLHFGRPCHYASRIVHVCDIYDALCTDRPYRAAWEPERALAYLEEKSGTEVDGRIVRAFATMVRGAVETRTPLEA